MIYQKQNRGRASCVFVYKPQTRASHLQPPRGFLLTFKTVSPLHFLPNGGETRLSQRVAMDDLASYFVEERSKVR
jgi:hypothetical protein